MGSEPSYKSLYKMYTKMNFTAQFSDKNLEPLQCHSSRFFIEEEDEKLIKEVGENN